MIELENIKYLWALAAIPAFFLMYLLVMYWRRWAINKFGERSMIIGLIPHFPNYKQASQFLLLMIAFAMVVIGVANPQRGTKLEKVKREGVDVVIAIDVSSSMLAEDVKPNRLERAKQFVSSLINKMYNDRVAIIVLAGNAYLQMPLTVHYAAAKMFLGNINTRMIPSQGTAIGDAIRLAMKSFEEQEKKHKSLIVITDGENHDDDALEIAKKAAEEGVILHAVGVGTIKGAPIPVYVRNVQVDYKKDRQGSIVLSKLNEQMLQQLAVATTGQYFRLAGGKDEIMYIMKEIESMEKKEFEERIFTDYEDKFQYFLAAALLFLTLEFFVSDRKSRWLGKFMLFNDKR